MNKVSRYLLLFSFAVAPAYAAESKGEWTGYLTDSHCGKKMASKDHSDDCMQKCVKSGSKAHLVTQKDEAMYELDDAAKTKGMVGKLVTVKGTLDSEKKAIKVESISPAAEKN